MTPARTRADVLVFVEDPGAANFVADLPQMLARDGLAVHLATSGPATAYLAQRGLYVDPLEAGCGLETLMAQLAPRLLVVGTAENPDSHGLRLVASAAARRIPSVGVLDSSANLAYRFRGRTDDPLAFCPDIVVVPDTITRDGLVEMGLGDDRIVVAGHPHWDHVRAAHHALQQADCDALRSRHFRTPARDRTVVVFAAELSGGVAPDEFRYSDEYTLRGGGGSTGRTEIVIEEFLAAAAPSRRRLHLVLRLHPKQSRHDLSDYHGAFDTISQPEPSLEVVYAADAVVGMTSMFMVEAALMERPTLSIVPRAKEAAWLPTIGAGVTPCAFDRTQVCELVTRLVDNPKLPDRAVLDHLFPPGALERLAATCERVGLLSKK